MNRTLAMFWCLTLGIIVLSGAGCDRKAEPAPRYKLKLDSVPEGARVFNLRGREMGRTPFTADLNPGDYALKLELENHEPQWLMFTISPDRKEHHYRLALEPVTSSILVVSTPEGAQVSLGERPIGITPAVVPNLAVGTHVLKLERAGYAPQTTQVEITDARPRKVVVSLSSNIGRMALTSTPSGAHVFIDDREHGVTPYQAELPEGKYRVRISKTGYSEVNDVIMVGRASTVEKSFSLAEMPGRLTVTTEPDKADVLINGRPYGQTPLNVELPAGNHTIRVALQGFDADTRDVTVAAASESVTHFALTRNTGGIDLLVNPPGTTIYINGKLHGVTEQDGDNTNLSRLIQLRKLNAGTYTITAAHRHAVPHKRDIDVNVPRGAIARPAPINLWVANAELKLTNGSVRIGRVYSETQDEVLFGPEPGVRIKYSRAEIEYLKPLTDDDSATP